MQLRRFDDIKEFWQCAQTYLLQYEAEHNALLGALHTLLDYPERYPEPPYLALVQASDQVLAIAIRTPPKHLLLSKALDLDAFSLIAEDLRQEKLPGVNGLVSETAAFVAQWQAVSGQVARQECDMRLYQLTQVEPVVLVDGSLRVAVEGDRSLLLQWLSAFEIEAGLPAGEVERIVDVRLKQQTLYLWEDGSPVSVVGGKQFSATAARIAPVYTPPQYRRKGYATASVATLSQRLLDQGCDRCFLFTDLANPISNAIYQKIGYQPMCDWHEYTFTPAG